MATVKELIAQLHAEADKALQRSQNDVDRLNKRADDLQQQLNTSRSNEMTEEDKAQLAALQSKIAAIDPNDPTTVADAQAVAQDPTAAAATTGAADPNASSTAAAPSSTSGDPTSQP